MMMIITKWEYCLNAIYYCIWLMDIRFDNGVWRIMDRLIPPVSKYFFYEVFSKEMA